jgi:hypothetical protein
VHYSPVELGAVGPPPTEMPDAEMFKKSLLERAGLEQRKPGVPKKDAEPERSDRYDITNDAPGQIRFRHHPI